MTSSDPATGERRHRGTARAETHPSSPEGVERLRRDGKRPRARKDVPGEPEVTERDLSPDAPAIKSRRASALSRATLRQPAGQARRSKADEAYQAIRDAIIDGSLAPGALLDKPAICRDLRLSRFPVTAAIARLAYERLVEVEPQRGSFVSRIDARGARELMLVRRGIEVELAGEAAARFDESGVGVLARILRYQQAALDADDFQDFHRLDHAFHDQIVEMLGFSLAGEILASLRLRVERVRRILLPIPGRVRRTFAEHEAIFAAIARRDVEAAREAMRTHLQRVLDEFEALGRERPDLFAH
jgi:DNA-binding GntR family transcriptional regulator